MQQRNPEVQTPTRAFRVPSRSESMSGSIKRVTGIVVTWALLCTPAWADSACFAEPADRFQTMEQELQSLYQLAQNALDGLSGEDYRIESRQQEVGESPEALFAWVRDNTRLLNYQGALRGGRGTLMDRSGSHLDRALLLAELLESAGHQARLARATLDTEAVSSIQTSMNDGSAGRGSMSPPEAAADTSDEAYELAAERLGTDPQDIRNRVQQADQQAQKLNRRVLQQVETQSSALSKHVEWSDASATASDNMQAALADHWWVQLRTRQGWQDLDPSLPDHQPGDRLHAESVENFWPDDLPPEAVHRLTIEVVAERLEKGRLQESTALSHDVSALDLLGQPVVVDIHPRDLPDAATMLGGGDNYEPGDLPKMLMAQNDWLPLVVIGDEPESQQRILADGRVAAMGATAQAEALEKASGLLGQLSAGRGESAPAPELSAVFLRLTVHAPGRAPETFERALMDVLGPHRRAGSLHDFEFTESLRQARAVGMLSTTEILAQTNWWPVNYTMGHLLHGAMQNRQAALATVHATRRDDPRLMGGAIESLSATGTELVTLAHHRHARSPHRNEVVLTRMNLLSSFERTELVNDKPVLTRGFDIIDNRVEVIATGNADAREVSLTQGVLDTVLEAELLSTGPDVRNTSLEFADALATGSNWSVIDENTLPTKLDKDVAARIQLAFDAGQLVVMPIDQDNTNAPSWWRVDPATGATLGMGPNGRGQMTEQILALMNSIDNAASAVATVQNIWSCILNKPSPDAAQCCIAKTSVDLIANNALGKVSDAWVEIASWAIDSKIYLAALGSVFGEAHGTIADSLVPDPC